MSVLRPDMKNVVTIWFRDAMILASWIGWVAAIKRVDDPVLCDNLCVHCAITERRCL